MSHLTKAYAKILLSFFILFASGSLQASFVWNSWSTPVTLSSSLDSMVNTGYSTFPIEMGSSGNAVAVWAETTTPTTVKTASFNGTSQTWSSTITIYTEPSSSYTLLAIALAVDSNGDAVVMIWDYDGTNSGVLAFTSTFGSNTWNSTTFSSSSRLLSRSNPHVIMNSSSGNAISTMANGTTLENWNLAFGGSSWSGPY